MKKKDSTRRRREVELHIHRRLAIHYLLACEQSLVEAIKEAKGVFKLWGIRDRKSVARAFDIDAEILLRITKSVRSVFEHYQP